MQNRFDMTPIQPIVSDQNVVARSVVNSLTHPVVIIHKQGQSSTKARSDELIELARSVDLGPVVDLSCNEWLWSSSPLPNFNCHTLAIGSHIGLGPGDWLEGKSSEATMNRNPARTLLNDYFERVTGTVKDNDVFVFENTSSNHLVHSGFIRWIDGQLMAVSKFGEGPILMTTLNLLVAVFSNDFDQIEWYSPKPIQPARPQQRLRPARPIRELAVPSSE